MCLMAPAFSQDVQTAAVNTYSSGGSNTLTDIGAHQSDSGAIASYQGIDISAASFAEKNSLVDINAGQNTNNVLFPTQGISIEVGNYANKNAVTIVGANQNEKRAFIGSQGISADILTSGNRATTVLDLNQQFKGGASEQVQLSSTSTLGTKSADAYVNHRETSLNFFGADQGVYANDYPGAVGPVKMNINTG